jgi:hypothetical protein
MLMPRHVSVLLDFLQREKAAASQYVFVGVLVVGGGALLALHSLGARQVAFGVENGGRGRCGLWLRSGGRGLGGGRGGGRLRGGRRGLRGGRGLALALAAVDAACSLGCAYYSVARCTFAGGRIADAEIALGALSVVHSPALRHSGLISVQGSHFLVLVLHLTFLGLQEALQFAAGRQPVSPALQGTHLFGVTVVPHLTCGAPQPLALHSSRVS